MTNSELVKCFAWVSIVLGILFVVAIWVFPPVAHAQPSSRRVYIDEVGFKRELTPTGAHVIGIACQPSGCYVLSEN